MGLRCVWQWRVQPHRTQPLYGSKNGTHPNMKKKGVSVALLSLFKVFQTQIHEVKLVPLMRANFLQTRRRSVASCAK